MKDTILTALAALADLLPFRADCRLGRFWARAFVVPILTMLLYAGAMHGQAAVIYVSAAQTNNAPDGASWSTAFVTVQEAIHAASDGDAVWVAAGTYFENVTLSNGVALYGGFNGTETDVSQRNWNTNFTTLDGRQSNSVIVIAAGATNTTHVDGFTIRNGRASAGGGIYCSNASPLLRNNRIIFNLATNDGGGIYCYLASPLIASNLIQGNIVNSGIYGGAGIGCLYSAPMIQGNRIIANSHFTTSGSSAGGISCYFGESPEIFNNILVGNTAVHDPAGIGNTGGIFIHGANSPRIINNTIAWCQSGSYDGGISCDTSSATIANNIITFCSGGISGIGGMTLKNNCVFGNGHDYTGFSNPTGTNGNISADPQFATNVFFPDVHILSTSPCRDAGDDTTVPVNSVDIDGDPRFLGAAVDIGADEFNGVTPVYAPVIVRVSTAGDDRNDGSTWAQAKRTVQAAIDAATLNGGEVWVAAGIYYENLTLRHFVFLYGGFAGNETNRTQRDWTANAIILDGSQSGSVITANDLQQWNAIDGFVIRNGKAVAGAGIYCSESSPTIAHNQITNNAGTSSYLAQGAGLYCVSFSPYGISAAIVSNVFAFNQAAVGGGICCDGFRSFPLIANNRFEANTAAVIARIPFTGANGGGGIFSYHSAMPRIEGNYFLKNVATNAPGPSYPGSGGAICVDNSTVRIINNTLIGNVARSTAGVYPENGGGISAPSGIVVANNLIAFGSSGLCSPGSSTNLNNIRNNCIYGNATNYLRTADFTGLYGNISVDPLLLATNDYHLNTNSPCINAGGNASVTSTTDFDGNPRVVGSVVDIGVHEMQGVTSVISYAWLQQYGLPTDGSADYADTDGDGASNWLEWQGSSNPTNALSLPAPLMTIQPASLSRVRGVNATFAVSVLSIPPASYQWQFNGTNLPGATEPSFTVTNVQPVNAGIYRVIVTNTFGTTISSNALLELGTIAAWGGNGYGQATVPLGATGTVAVGGGYSFSVRLKADGTLDGWGQNDYDQLDFPGYLSDVVAIAAGYASTLALRADGTVLGFGTQDTASVPTDVTNAVAIAIGENHAMALKADGKVVAWGGYNNYGETTVPEDLSNVVAIACGWMHSLALKADGSVVAWGSDLFDQTSVPAGLENVVAIAAGSLHSLALKADGTVVAWGGATAATNVPAGLSNVVAISSAAEDCLALRGEGTVIAWGRTDFGQTDVPVGLTNVIAIASGWYHDLALVGEGPPVQSVRATATFSVSHTFNIRVPTQNGRVFRLEFKTSLQDADWMALPLIAGTGKNVVFSDSTATNSQRFYRVRRW